MILPLKDSRLYYPRKYNLSDLNFEFESTRSRTMNIVYRVLVFLVFLLLTFSLIGIPIVAFETAKKKPIVGPKVKTSYKYKNRNQVDLSSSDRVWIDESNKAEIVEIYRNFDHIRQVK